MNVFFKTGLPDTVRDLTDNPPVRVFPASIGLRFYGALHPHSRIPGEYPFG